MSHITAPHFSLAPERRRPRWGLLAFIGVTFALFTLLVILPPADPQSAIGDNASAPLTLADLERADGGTVAADSLIGRWTFITSSRDGCSGPCSAMLQQLSQVVGQSENRDRLQVVHIALGAADFSTLLQLEQNHPGTQIWLGPERAHSQLGEQLRAAGLSGELTQHIYLIDDRARPVADYDWPDQSDRLAEAPDQVRP